MSHRIPLVATVVGALFIGGATTGTTLALWHDSTSTSAGLLKSGVMSMTAGSPTPTSVSVERGHNSARSVTTRIADTSQDGSKNLRQNTKVTAVRLSGDTSGLVLSQLRLAVTPKAGDCPTTAPTSTALDYTSDWLGLTQPAATDQWRDVCITVSAPASAATGKQTGILEIDFKGFQFRPGATAPSGWSTFASTVSVGITVTAPVVSAPSLGCAAGKNGTLQLPTGSYDVLEADPAVGSYTVIATERQGTFTPTTIPTTTNAHRWYRIRAANTPSAPHSNTIQVRRSGASGNFDCGEPTP